MEAVAPVPEGVAWRVARVTPYWPLWVENNFLRLRCQQLWISCCSIERHGHWRDSLLKLLTLLSQLRPLQHAVIPTPVLAMICSFIIPGRATVLMPRGLRLACGPFSVMTLAEIRIRLALEHNELRQQEAELEARHTSASAVREASDRRWERMQDRQGAAEALGQVERLNFELRVLVRWP